LPRIAETIESAMKSDAIADVRRACAKFLTTASDFYQVRTCAVRRHLRRVNTSSSTKTQARRFRLSPKPSASCSKIGYDEKGLNARAELLRRFGHEVISVTQNEAAKVALSSYRDVDLFIVGHTAQERTRKEMVAWLKGNYPNVKIVALNPSRDTPQIARRLIFPDPAVVALDPGISLPLTAECKLHASHPANLRYNFAFLR